MVGGAHDGDPVLQRHRGAERVVLLFVARRELGLLGPEERIDPQRVPRALVVDPQPDDAPGDLDPRAALHAVGVEGSQIRVACHRPAACVDEGDPPAARGQHRAEVAGGRDLDREGLAARSRRRRGEDEALLHAERAVDVLLVAAVRAPVGRAVLDDVGFALRPRDRGELRSPSDPGPAQLEAPGVAARPGDAERAVRQRDVELMRLVVGRRASRESTPEAVRVAARLLAGREDARPEGRRHPRLARRRRRSGHGIGSRGFAALRSRAARGEDEGQHEAEHDAGEPRGPRWHSGAWRRGCDGRAGGRHAAVVARVREGHGTSRKGMALRNPCAAAGGEEDRSDLASPAPPDRDDGGRGAPR
jgi:hypothetical protein